MQICKNFTIWTYKNENLQYEYKNVLKCMRNDFSLLISLLQSEDKAKINIFQ